MNVVQTQPVMNKLNQCDKECKEKENINCLHTDARSLGNKQLELEILTEKKFDIIGTGITETLWDTLLEC